MAQFLFGNGFAITEGDNWRVRRKAVQPSLHKAYLDLMISRVFGPSAVHLASKLEVWSCSRDGKLSGPISAVQALGRLRRHPQGVSGCHGLPNEYLGAMHLASKLEVWSCSKPGHSWQPGRQLCQSCLECRLWVEGWAGILRGYLDGMGCRVIRCALRICSAHCVTL